MKIPVFDPFNIAKDAKMPFLKNALDPIKARNVLEAYVPEDSDGHLRAIRVTRYKPERRCLIEYDLGLSGLPGEKTTLVGKVRAKAPDRFTYHIIHSLWNAGFGTSVEDGICVPEPLGIIPEFNMVLQRKVSGDSATQLLLRPGSVPLAERIARAIHKLHKAHIPVSRRHTVKDELDILHERLSSVVHMMPELKKRLMKVLDSCERLGGSLPEPELCGIHRDFYSDHVIVNEARMYLLDFDLFCKGDPGLDIGNFLGHLIELSLRTFQDPTAMQDRIKAIEDQFVALSGEHTRTAIHAYTTLTLVRHIHVSTLFPDRRKFTRSLLELCEQQLRNVG